MATCKMWAVKGRIDHLIDYVENPEKTTDCSEREQNLFNLMSYVSREDKTKSNVYITGINCLPELAVEQWIETKKRFGKEDNILAFHGFQSFLPGETDPRTAHEIGEIWAREVWGDRFEIVLTTHLDKEHIHNHIALNSVSCKDGYKYNNDKAHIRKMRQISDKICREHGLSVLKEPRRKAPPRMIHLAEKEGNITRNTIIKEDIDFAIHQCNRMSSFYKTMEYMGYEFERGDHFAVRIQGDSKFFWTCHLGRSYTGYAINNRVVTNRQPVINLLISFKPPEIYRSFQYRGTSYRYSDLAESAIMTMYYIFVCLLLIAALPFARNNVAPSPERHYIHPSLRLEAIKLENYMKHLNYLTNHKINTVTDIGARMNLIKDQLSHLVSARQIQRNIMKRTRSSMEEKTAAATERDKLTARIVPLRDELKLCEAILERSGVIEKKLNFQKEHERKLEELSRQTKQEKEVRAKNRDWER